MAGFYQQCNMQSWNENTWAEAALAALSQVGNQSVSVPQLGSAELLVIY